MTMRNESSARRQSSRRDFLRTSAGAVSAFAAGTLAIRNGLYAAGDDVLKVALIGCGGRGAGAAANCLNVKDNLKIVCLADLFEDRVKRAFDALSKNEKYKGKFDVTPDRKFVGVDACQKALDSGVDLVIIATPPGFRPEQYAAAVKAGKHVFMEKPCCVDAPGFRSLMETNKLADEKGMKVAVGLQRRHSQEYIPRIEKLQDGSVGKINLMRVFWNGSHAGAGYGKREPGQTEMEFQIRNWNHFRWLSGDHIVEQHVHNIDVANWVMKDEHPVEANGMGAQRVRKDSQIFDHHFVEFKYADGTMLYSQCRQIPGCWNTVTEFVYGSNGATELGGNGSDGYDGEHADLVAAIRKGQKLNDGWHGATSSFTAVLGRMATYSGKVVTWDDAVAKGPSEGPREFTLTSDPPALPDASGSYESHLPIPALYKPY